MKRNNILRFIINHRSLNKFFSHLIKRAREIISGRKRGHMSFCLMPNLCKKCGKPLTLFEGWTCLECEQAKSEQEESEDKE